MMTVAERRELIERDIAEGMTVREVAAKYRIGFKSLKQLRCPSAPALTDGDRAVPPQRSHEMVAWRHKFIAEMTDAGFGCSFIGAVLRLDHSSVIYHQRGKCRCQVV